MIIRKTLIASLAFSACLSLVSTSTLADDCLGTAPGSCSIDEDTAGALTIGDGNTLTINATPLEINHTIDGDTDGADSEIVSQVASGVVTQNAEIGSTIAINALSLNNDSTWNVHADLTTDGSGDDIDLDSIGGGETLNINNGATITGDIVGHAGDNVNVGQDINGGDFSIAGDIDGISLDLQSGDLTVTGSTGSTTEVNSATIASDSTLTLNGSVNNIIDLDLSGELQVSSTSNANITTYDASANAGRYTLNIDRDGETTNAAALDFDCAGCQVDLSNATFGFFIESGSEVLISETIEDVIVGDTGGAIVLPTIDDTSYLYDYNLVDDGSNNADLTIQRRNLNEATTDTNNKTYADNLLSDLAITADPVIRSTQDNLFTASSQTQFNEVLESTQPAIDSSSTTTDHYVSNQTVAMAAKRLAYLRNSYSGSTGINTGEEYKDRGDSEGRMWAQVFGAAGTQRDREGINGYESLTTGVTVGIDSGGFEEDLVLGMALTYAYTENESDNANSTEQNIRTYQLSFYGSHELEDDYFVNGTIAWGISDVKQTRFNVGATSSNAESHYDTEQLIGHLEYGRDIDYFNERLTLTPSVSTQFTYINPEDYRETGAEGANLSVQYSEMLAWDFGANLRAQWKYITDNDVFILPELSARYAYDVVGDTTEALSTFEAGGQQILSKGFSPQVDKLTLGSGIGFAKDDIEFNLKYDYLMQGDLDVHSGYLRGVYKF